MKYVLSSIAAILLAGAASAATTGFSVVINGSSNIPTVTVTNSGDSGDISGLTLAIGNTAYNFDSAYNEAITGTLGFTLDPTLDTNDGGGLRSDFATYTFTGFNPGEVFAFDVDVDIDSSNTNENYRTRLLPGGSLTVQFTGGEIAELFVDLTPASTTPNSYSYSASFTPAAVPLPAGLPLMLSAFGAAYWLKRRKQVA